MYTMVFFLDTDVRFNVYFAICDMQYACALQCATICKRYILCRRQSKVAEVGQWWVWLLHLPPTASISLNMSHNCKNPKLPFDTVSLSSSPSSLRSFLLFYNIGCFLQDSKGTQNLVTKGQFFFGNNGIEKLIEIWAVKTAEWKLVRWSHWFKVLIERKSIQATLGMELNWR